MKCPFCQSAEAELVSAFGGQMITSQYRCRACNTYFEAVREDFEADCDPVRAAAPEPVRAAAPEPVRAAAPEPAHQRDG